MNVKFSRRALQPHLVAMLVHLAMCIPQWMVWQRSWNPWSLTSGKLLQDGIKDSVCFRFKSFIGFGIGAGANVLLRYAVRAASENNIQLFFSFFTKRSLKRLYW